MYRDAQDLDNYVGAEADIETAYPVLQLPFDPFRYAVLPDHARDLSITSALASLAARAYSTVTTELISEDIPDTTFARERCVRPICPDLSLNAKTQTSIQPSHRKSYDPSAPHRSSPPSFANHDRLPPLSSRHRRR